MWIWERAEWLFSKESEMCVQNKACVRVGGHLTKYIDQTRSGKYLQGYNNSMSSEMWLAGQHVFVVRRSKLLPITQDTLALLSILAQTLMLIPMPGNRPIRDYFPGIQHLLTSSDRDY